MTKEQWFIQWPFESRQDERKNNNLLCSRLQTCKQQSQCKPHQPPNWSFKTMPFKGRWWTNWDIRWPGPDGPWVPTTESPQDSSGSGLSLRHGCSFLLQISILKLMPFIAQSQTFRGIGSVDIGVPEGERAVRLSPVRAGSSPRRREKQQLTSFIHRSWWLWGARQLVQRSIRGTENTIWGLWSHSDQRALDTVERITGSNLKIHPSKLSFIAYHPNQTQEIGPADAEWQNLLLILPAWSPIYTSCYHRKVL